MIKRFTPTLMFLALVLSMQAQVNFFDNFDTYTAGQKLGPQSPQWTTWSGAQGGADDINVTATGAYSGSNCLYFTSTSANGGPADIVLPFSGPHNTGTFTFSHYIKVANGKIGYFNFQANNTVGQAWALNVDYGANGVFSIYDNNNILFQSAYPQGQWFQFTLEANLNTNDWVVKVNGTAVGTFQNSTFQIASIDYFCPNNNASFWIDDVSFSHTPYTPSGTNGAVVLTLVDNGLVSQTRIPQVSVRNLGTSAINSFSIAVANNGTSNTQTISGVNIAPLAVYNVMVNDPITLQNGLNTVTASISNVNGGGPDAVAADDSKTFTLTPIQPATDNLVILEEGTGTWCQWCPRGAVFLGLFSTLYEGFFQGIAVHNADPMADPVWDAGFGQTANGYPSASVDRGSVDDPSAMNPQILERVQVAPHAKMRNGASWDPVSRTLNVSLFTTALQDMNGNYKLACALVEDSVRGTGSGYNQSNAYAGGNNGTMGGFESLPNPVPAASMVYDHVGRAIAPGYGGLDNAFGGNVISGDTFYHCFTFNVPAGWNENRLHIVGLLFGPDGRIDNGSSTSLNEAISNGFVCENIVSSPFIAADKVSVYPNPVQSETHLFMNLSTPTKVSATLTDLNGKVCLEKTWEGLNNSVDIPVLMNHLSPGLYLLSVTLNEERKTFRIEKQ